MQKVVAPSLLETSAAPDRLPSCIADGPIASGHVEIASTHMLALGQSSAQSAYSRSPGANLADRLPFCQG